jgi:hypothetical protein
MTEISTSHTSKYIYNINESESHIYIFELILYKNEKKIKTIRKIITDKKGPIVTLDDTIMYNNINKIILNVLDINNPSHELSIDINIDHEKQYSSFINSSIYVEIFSNLDYFHCNYNII